MIQHRLFRYVLGGGVVTLFTLLLLFCFNSLLHIHYLLATSGAFLISLGVSYCVHKYWTFKDNEGTHRRQLSQHTLLVTINFFLNGALMYVFVDGIHFIPIVAQICTAAIIAIENFILYNTIIFKKTAKPVTG